MTDEQKQKRLWNLANHYAKSKGLVSEAEDFAQEVLIEDLNNRKKQNGHSVNLRWALANYMRKFYAPYVSEDTSVAFKRERYHGSKQFDDGMLDSHSVQKYHSREYDIFDFLLAFCEDQIERSYTVLVYIYGMEMEEVALCFGVKTHQVMRTLSLVRQRAAAGTDPPPKPKSLPLIKSAVGANVKKRRNSSTQYFGVSKVKTDHVLEKPWRATFRVNGVALHLGYFKTEIEAAKAYNKKAKEYEDRPLNEV